MSLVQRMVIRNKFLPFFAASVAVFVGSLLIAIGILLVYKFVNGDVSGPMEFVRHYLFSDFSQMVYLALTDNPYDSNGFSTIYLPLNLLLLYPFALICKSCPVFHSLDNYYGDAEERYVQTLEYNSAVLGTWQFWVSFVLYAIIHLALIAIVLYKMRQWGNVGEFACAFGALLFSSFIIVGLVRGTNVLQTLLLSLIFVWLYRHPNKFYRELALLCLAAAGTMKFYPLLLGALLIREKRYWESVRVGLYFLVLSLLPFVIFGDIISALKFYVANVYEFVNLNGKVGTCVNFSVYSVFQYFFSLFGLRRSLIARIISIIAIVVTAVFCITCALLTKSRFASLTVVCCGMMLITPVSYYYVSMFFVIPLVYFIDEWKGFDKLRKWLYGIFFCFFAFLPLSVTAWYIPQCFIMLVILVVEFRSVVKDRFKVTACTGDN